MSRKKDFAPQDVLKALPWCNRHCCLCGKNCGSRIEVAHIDPQGPATLDNVGLTIIHREGPHWVKVWVRVAGAQGNQQFGYAQSSHYDGTRLWNLNPGFGVNGHLSLPAEVNLESEEPVRARIDVWQSTFYEKENGLLPVG